MASKLIVLSITATLLIGTGCSKNRGWLSRNDYKEMHDPFMEPSDGVAKSSDRTSGSEGRASFDDSGPSIADREDRRTPPGVAGPKPIRPTGASGDTIANGRRVSPATYPTEPGSGEVDSEQEAVKSYSGPALSDFLQKRQTAMSEAATEAEQLPARNAASPRSNLNPAATHAALPQLSPEAENFSSFLTNKSDAVAKKSERANQTVQNAAADVNDFSSWAEQQKAEWSSSAESASATVSGAPTQARAKAQSVFLQAKTASQEMADSMTPDFDGSDDETATPLLQQNFTPPESSGSVLSRAKAPAANDFDPDSNSFEEFHSSESTAATSQKPAAPTGRSGNSRSSLDDGFRMDTGWKPAHLTRP